jgi:dUTP pyrophosphatase
MKKEVEVFVTVEEGSELPVYYTAGAAGADVKAFLTEDVVLLPCHRVVIPTGLRLAIPNGFEIQVRPRSGLASKHGITVLNSPGTIDSDYRGELKIIVINHSDESFTITSGMRIAQLVIVPVYQAKFFITQGLDETKRSKVGCSGSTGI